MVNSAHCYLVREGRNNNALVIAIRVLNLGSIFKEILS
jgi:hypothetical protein